jgi:hypothetical protein
MSSVALVCSTLCWCMAATVSVASKELITTEGRPAAKEAMACVKPNTPQNGKPSKNQTDHDIGPCGPRPETVMGRQPSSPVAQGHATNKKAHQVEQSLQQKSKTQGAIDRGDYATNQAAQQQLDDDEGGHANKHPLCREGSVR